MTAERGEYATVFCLRVYTDGLSEGRDRSEDFCRLVTRGTRLLRAVAVPEAALELPYGDVLGYAGGYLHDE